jgi:glycosyltransferase involved in cell wall biosynthesis
LRAFRLRRLERYLFMASLLRRALRRRRDYEVLHVHQVLYPAVVASIAGALARRPVIARVAGSGESSDFRWLARGLGLNRWLVRRLLTRIVAVDPVTRSECLAAGFASEKVVVIPNGVPVPDTRHERPGGTVEVVWTGVLRPEKRVDLLLQAWSQAGTPGQLRIIGDGPERARLAPLAGQAWNVEMTGEVPDASALLRTADIFVLPSDAEGMSNSLLEAMAAGCACVATAVGGNVELLGGDNASIAAGGYSTAEGGLLVNAGDADGLAAAIRTLSQSPDLRAELGTAAHARCRHRFSIAAVAESYRELYEELGSGLSYDL